MQTTQYAGVVIALGVTQGRLIVVFVMECDVFVICITTGNLD